MAAVISPATASGSVGLSQFLRPCPLSVQNVAEALDHNVAVTQHVGQLTHLLGIGDRLVEGDAEIVGAQNRQIRIVRLQVLIAMAVDHRQIVVVVLL